MQQKPLHSSSLSLYWPCLDEWAIVNSYRPLSDWRTTYLSCIHDLHTPLYSLVLHLVLTNQPVVYQRRTEHASLYPIQSELNTYIKYTNPARGILDSCKQKLRPLRWMLALNFFQVVCKNTFLHHFWIEIPELITEGKEYHSYTGIESCLNRLHRICSSYLSVTCIFHHCSCCEFCVINSKSSWEVM